MGESNIVNDALTDSEEIKLLYSSRAPDNNDNLEYYIHIVAVSQRSDDTINILTLIANDFSIDDEDKVFNFFDQDSIISKKLVEQEKLFNGENIDGHLETNKKSCKRSKV